MSQPSAPMIDPNDLGRGPLIMGLSWTFATIAIGAVTLRFYIRTKLSIGLSLDDWLMFAAVICNTVSQSFISVGYHYGLGKHDVNLTGDEMIHVLKWMWLANTPGLLVSILARISIAILLVRLFGVTHAWLKWFIIGTTGLCTILTVIILPCTYLQSTPVEANWNTMIQAKHWDPRIYIDLAFFGQALWTFSDLTFVLFPVMVIWNLHMATRQRVGVIILMSMSLLTMVMSILKTIGLSNIVHEQTDPTATDVQYGASLEILWSLLEQAFVIIMGCVPPLRAVVKLEIAQSLSSSLASMLRRGRSSKSSSKSSSEGDESSMKFENHNNVHFIDLENSTEKLASSRGKGLDFITAAIYEPSSRGNEQELRNDTILSTRETRISYSPSDSDMV